MPSTRSGFPRARPDWVETARIEFPSGRHADEVCPTELGRRCLVRADGDDHLPSLAGPARRRRPSGRDAARPRSPAGHRLRRRGRGRGRGAGPARRARLRRLPQDLRRPRHPHLRADRAALDVHRRAPRGDRLRPRARAADARAGDDEAGGRRSAARRSSSTTTRTRATGRSPPPTASAPSPARPCPRR